uniref:Uncharacterized protein n=1 Tax=Acrobeloides nanus TaxID=290746 RepID=A0A914CW84_9BILA
MRSSETNHDADMHPLRPCSVPNPKATVAVVLVLLYASLFIFATQYSRFFMYIMTGMVAVILVLLYTAGILCVVYMICNGYPIEPSTDRELKECTPSVKLESNRISPKSPKLSVIEIKF